uniref:SJCHGC08615 protein n=1 Tax=Schistosoma japonicum TaxID=6182 RepID=Q5DCT3_SCHJA|nr:SJCHGC08615 protein [Schistosoma japonicum]
MFNLSSYHSLLKTEENCLDVGGPATGCSFEEKTHQNTSFTSVPELYQGVPVEQSKDSNHTWVLCERKYLIQILSSLRKVLRSEYFHNSQFHDIERLDLHKELSLHHAANTLRRIFAELYRHIAKCYSIHLWCVKSLSETLLSIYPSGFCILWGTN